VSVQEVSRQEATPRPGSEPDTLVEPDTAVSPNNPLVAVTASHEGRFPDGGASAISHAWTRDGGRTWRHAPVAGITTATGGAWNRASDPVLAFAPDGSVYLSVLVLNDDPADCRTSILVLRSTNGGATFGPPRTARYSAVCEDSLDKNWIVVDNGRRSPHRGRIYQFWTSFLPTEAQQRVRWSDDHGVTWSADSILNPGATYGSQNSQPVVLEDGSVVDTYLDYTYAEEEIEAPEVRERGEAAAESTPAATPPARTTEADDDPGVRILAQRSTDGGRTWSVAVTAAEQVGLEVPGVRCCLPSATVDPVTQTIDLAWISEDAHDILLARSHGGLRWGAPRLVTRPGADTLYRVNVDVASWGGVATVSYADQDTAVAAGRYWQQKAVTSYDDARHFGEPLILGPRYDTRYAAQARGIFPGDYIGSAATRGRVYLNWALAYAPADPSATYHQTLWGAALRQ
jgi:BNR/Asp-box repeat protein